MIPVFLHSLQISVHVRQAIVSIPLKLSEIDKNGFYYFKQLKFHTMKKVIIGILGMVLVATTALYARNAVKKSADCCKPGAGCCYPGSPCCGK